jgi:hypothetical protein
MGSFPHAPGSLVVFGITCTAAAALLILMLGWHVARRVLDIPRIPRGAGGYVLLVLLCLGLLGAGIGALAVAAGLEDWQGVPARAPLAEVQCHRVSPATARLSFVPLRPDGARGPEEMETVDACELALERLRFAGVFARFGLVERHRLSRVGTRSHSPDTADWTALPRPFGMPVAVATQQKVVVPDGERYRVIADERGLRLEK